MIKFKNMLLFLLIGFVILSISSVSAISDDNGDLNALTDRDADFDDKSISLADNMATDVNEDSTESDLIGESGDELILDESEDENYEDAINTSLISNSTSQTNIYGDEYVLQLLDNESNPLADQLVSFTITNGANTYHDDLFTDENGRVFLKLNFKGGKWNIFAFFAGDETYRSSEFNSSVVIYEKTFVEFSKKYALRGDSINIRIKTSSGNYLSNVHFTFIADGKTYTKTLDSKGIFTFKLPDKQYCLMSVSFVASGYLLSGTGSTKLPIYVRTYIKNNNLFVLKGKSYGITLKNKAGHVLKNKAVRFIIDGKQFSSKTNSKGIAYVKMKFSRGEHTVQAIYDGSSYYYRSSKTITLTVLDPSGQWKKGLNQKNAKSMRAYKIAAGYCKVTKSIKKLAKKLTKGYTSTVDKAAILFHYVADEIYYGDYANSRKGAHKTLKSKYGNCCDQASLVVALCRASGIPARYAHAQGCTFSGGHKTGHVWAQIKVGKVWYVADPTSYRNTLGHINNWNTKHYYRLHTYSYIPF